MQAECTFQAFDNRTSTHYVPGPVPDFDINDEKLNSLTVPGKGTYVFQYEGHRGAPADKKPSPAASAPAIAATVASEPEPKAKKGKPMSEVVKAKIRATRAAKQAARQARLESEAA